MDDRKTELLNLFKDVDCTPVIIKLVDEMIYLETKLLETKKVLDSIKISHTTKEKYKFFYTLYKDSLSQYTNIATKLASILNKEDGGGEDSPLQEYFRKMQGDS